MGDIVVDVADIKFSSNPKEVLHGPSLGACIGLTLYDPEARAGGMGIFVLPDAGIAHSIAVEDHPYFFADQAIPKFLQRAVEYGIQPEKAKIVLAGGGRMSGQTGIFDLGSQNEHVAREVLDHYGLKPTHESLGGSINRSLSLELRTGIVRITSAGKEVAIL